jgi:hypothetical protein
MEVWPSQVPSSRAQNTKNGRFSVPRNTKLNQAPCTKSKPRLRHIFVFGTANGPCRHQLSGRIRHSEEAAVKFGTRQVPYGSIIVISRRQNTRYPIPYGCLTRTVLTFRSRNTKCGVQWATKNKNGQKPRAENQKQHGAEFFNFVP